MHKAGYYPGLTATNYLKGLSPNLAVLCIFMFVHCGAFILDFYEHVT